MANSKTIVVVGTSFKSWEDAARQVVKRAAQSVANITCVDVVHQSAAVNHGDIAEFRATVHLTFELNDDGSPGEPIEDEHPITGST